MYQIPERYFLCCGCRQQKKGLTVPIFWKKFRNGVNDVSRVEKQGASNLRAVLKTTVLKT